MGGWEDSLNFGILRSGALGLSAAGGVRFASRVCLGFTVSDSMVLGYCEAEHCGVRLRTATNCSLLEVSPREVCYNAGAGLIRSL